MAQQNDRIARLEVYAQKLKQRLASPVPPKHSESEGTKAGFKQMLEIDLTKTQATINKLKGI